MDHWQFLVNVYSAMGMGLSIGLEREFRQHPAGLRTNALVCMGSSIFMALTPLLNDTSSPTRIASYIISGIGFLGGGVILKQGINVRGMNTAATLWCSAAIGALCGSGNLLFALLATVSVLVVHLVFRPLSTYVQHHGRFSEEDLSYKVVVVCTKSSEAEIRDEVRSFLDKHGRFTVHSLSTNRLDEGMQSEIVAEIFSSANQEQVILRLVDHLLMKTGVQSALWEKNERFTD
jgi:putative Mg2+ transporter-C (MgtC) family protein